MNLHFRESNEQTLKKSEEIKIRTIEKVKENAEKALDDAAYIEKQKMTTDEHETAGEALNAPVNVFMGARNRRENAKRKGLRAEERELLYGKKLEDKRKKLKTLNEQNALKRQEKIFGQKRLAAIKKEKYKKLSKKRFTKGDVAKGLGSAAAGAIASESDPENRKNLEKMKAAARMPGKIKRAKSAAGTAYKTSSAFMRFMRIGGNKMGSAIISAFRAVVAMLTPMVAVIIGVIIIMAAILVIIFAADEEENASLCPYGDMYYWIRWETGTWDPDEAFGCVLGDGGKAYGIQLDYRYGLIPFNRWCYLTDKEKYKDLEPYRETGSVKLNDKEFAAIWTKLYNNNKEDFAEKQKQYAYNSYYKPVEEYMASRGVDLNDYDDVVKGAILSYSWQHGVNNAKIVTGECITKKKISDEEAIKKIYEKRIAKYPRFKSRYNEERDYAITLLNAAEMNVSNIIGSDTQKRIVLYATSGNSYGLGHGYCQAWVRCVYQSATGVRNSKCCAAAARDAWATTSGDIPVGAAIYSSKSYKSKVICGCGRNAGHVGIYVGNNKVVSMLNGPTTQTLSQWYSWFGYGGWSWNGCGALD